MPPLVRPGRQLGRAQGLILLAGVVTINTGVFLPFLVRKSVNTTSSVWRLASVKICGQLHRASAVHDDSYGSVRETLVECVRVGFHRNVLSERNRVRVLLVLARHIHVKNWMRDKINSRYFLAAGPRRLGLPAQ